jgi:hypothetical protein
MIEFIYISMTSLIGCHSTLFCTSSIGQRADVPTECWSISCPSLASILARLCCRYLRHLSEQHLQSAAWPWKLWGGALQYGVYWLGSCTLSDSICVPPWASQGLVWPQLDNFMSTCASQYWNFCAKYHRSRGSPCQLQTVQVVHRPCPRRKTKEQ